MHDPLGQLRLRFAGLALRTDSPQGQVYAGGDFTGADVTVAVLAEEIAADPDRKRAFGAAVRRLESEDPAIVHSVDLYATRPWAAIRTAPGQPGAEVLLEAVDLSPPSASDPRAGGPEQSVFQAGPADFATGPTAAPATHSATRPAAAQPNRTANTAVVAAVAVLVMVGGAVFYLFNDLSSDQTGQSAPPPPAATAAPAAAPSATATADDLATSMLRDVAPVSVVGPVWQPGDDTYTMAFPGWPFAFRAPATWQCVLGVYEPIPDAPAWQCVDTEPAGDGQRVNVILWECPTTCTNAEQAAMVEVWLDEPDLAQPAGSGRTVYVETERNVRDRYSIDLSHFAPDPADPDGPLRWHVGVYLESPFETRDAPLKILNDIVTQSS